MPPEGEGGREIMPPEGVGEREIMPPEGVGERGIMPPEGEGGRENHASRGGGRKGNHTSRGGGRDELELILMLTWMTYKPGKQSNHNSQSQKRIYYRKPVKNKKTAQGWKR